MSGMPEPSTAGLEQNGFTVLRSAFPEPLLAELVADAERYEFTLPRPHAGGELAMATLRDPAPRDAARWLAETAATEGFTSEFRPNEVSYQRYLPDGNGLPPHRDQRYYATCIAIVTLLGSATFAVHASNNREDIVDQWTTRPGEVIFLRGWRPGDPDPRPYHRIDPPRSGSRLMFQARYNVAAADPCSWLEELTAGEAGKARTMATRPTARRRPDRAAAAPARLPGKGPPGFPPPSDGDSSIR